MLGTNDAIWAIGLMSGTSMDGIDAAMIRTDGTRVLEFGPCLSEAYEPAFRQKFSQYLGQKTAPDDIVREFTMRNVKAVQHLIDQSGMRADQIGVIGFHGQTLFHNPDNRLTVQVGDGDLIAKSVGINVVNDFRTEDVLSGGEGAPLAPAYHQALAHDLDGPIVVLNLGGVGNVTYLNGDEILAFDTGPASAMIDDWVRRHTDQQYDQDGALARQGVIHDDIVGTLMANPYFDRLPPKSLDRDAFDPSLVAGLSLEDGAATLTAFTVQSLVRARDHMPAAPKRWLVTGGGRHNGFMLECIERSLQTPVEAVEVAGWRGDELEAEAFAFLAVRSLKGMPLSYPGTTGVPKPLTGGRLNKAA
ncbi:MAG: anhydro-N-acetylmuramic acid kinase [Sneathiella sp.]|nr:anhydro-N-acetylmuramic acid kinase [Sneathiella sp.]